MGAEAFASGDHIAFRASPSLELAAHETAHVVQQRQGVHVRDCVGDRGDAYEQSADAVADAVAMGKSVAPLLNARLRRRRDSDTDGIVQRNVTLDQLRDDDDTR